MKGTKNRIGAVEVVEVAQKPGNYINFTGWILVADFSQKVENEFFEITEDGKINFKKN